MLLMWQITNNVKALVFDTSSSNSGWKNGVAKLLEEQLGRKVFYHACRHHIYELVIRAVWKSIFGKETTGPENPMFNKFKRKWGNIDKTKSFKTLNFSDEWLQKKRVKSVMKSHLYWNTKRAEKTPACKMITKNLLS